MSDTVKESNTLYILNSKTCPKCKLSLLKEEFYIDNRRKDKLQSYCKKCVNSLNINIYYRTVKENKIVLVESKICKKCGENKNINEYIKGKTYKDGHMNTCKTCKNIERKRWRETGEWKQKYNEIRKTEEYKRKNREKRKEYTKRKLIEDPLFTKRYNLYSTFKITIEEYNQLLNKANHKCEICGITSSKLMELFPDKPQNRLNIDHNHFSKKIRGILCNNCNTGIGKFKDSEELLNKAIEYLKYKN